MPQVRQEMGRDDGCFWISAADFCKYFAGVQICRNSVGWKHHSEDLKARSGHINVMMLTVTGGPLEADISVHQKDQRAYMAEPGYPGEDKYEYVGKELPRITPFSQPPFSPPDPLTSSSSPRFCSR